ncbi:MAG TPA: hypothetical protein VF980_09015 [Thermoanaerobaculia bacterium]
MAIAIAVVLAAFVANAAEWSDTYIGFRTGHQYKETGNVNPIQKYILTFDHVSGYSYGQNWFGVDLLKSNSKDPSNLASPGNSDGAQEAYICYRHNLKLSKVFRHSLSFGPINDIMFTAGGDYNTKNTTFAPSTRKIFAGPTLSIRVPGYLNLGVLYDQEWNHNAFGGFAAQNGGAVNVTYKPTYMVSASWGIPVAIGPVNTTAKGFANYTGKKGQDGSGVQSMPETLVRAYWMLDAGSFVGARKGAWMIGPGWELWDNKFGVPAFEPGVPRPQFTQVNPRTNTFVMAVEAHF